MTENVARLSAALSDRYRIERELGQGGMATVYLAQDLKHKRKVALKVLKSELAAVLGAERFVQEITTTAALQHPHILPLFDSGSADGFLYYVMPFIDGETLRSKLDRETQLGIDEAVRITTAVADALDYAHRHGVIHRDIKPENILLHDGRPMVADFGIALALSAAAGGRMTETGMSLGTPHYMSPEQATAEKEITARSDIYSLASVLYEMLTGTPPHTGASAQQIIMRIVTDTARPVTELRKAVPPNVAAAVGQALEKLPADRFATAKEFADALANPTFATVATRAAVRTARPTGRRTALLATALGIMTLVAGWSLLRPRTPAPVSRYGLALPADQAPDEFGFALATSDGSRIVYLGPSMAGGPTGPQLWVKRRDAATAIPLAGTAYASAAAISPDDASLLFVQSVFLKRMPIDGGASVILAENVFNAPGSVTWLDDGSIVYAVNDSAQLVRIPPEGGKGVVVWRSDSLRAQNLTPLPDGRGVLFHACRLPCDHGAVLALDLHSGTAHLVQEGARGGYYIPGGQLVYIDQTGAGNMVPFDLRTLTSHGIPVGVLDSVSMSGVSPQLSVSASGTLLMRSGPSIQRQRFELVWVDHTGRQTPVDTAFTFRLTQFAGNVGWALSPDGTRLAIGLNTGSGDGIWIKSLPRGPVSRLTDATRPESRPRWTADGRSVTFTIPNGVILRRANGTGSDSILWNQRADEGLLSPDGLWLLIRQGARTAASGGRDIFVLRLGVDTVLAPLITGPYDEFAMALSPDGRWLAYESDESGRSEVYVRPFPNTNAGKVQVSNLGGRSPLWARNGRELFFLRADNTMMAVPVSFVPTLHVGELRPLFRREGRLAQVSSGWYTPWDVAADGRFIMVRGVDEGQLAVTPLIVVENWFEELKTKRPH